MTSGKVFGWFSGTWGQYSITFDKPMAACQGPFAYNWGGTYYAIKSGRQDEAAVQFLKALCCDPSVMGSLGDLPNNTVAAQKVVSKGKNPAAMKIIRIFIKYSIRWQEASMVVLIRSQNQRYPLQVMAL